MPAVSVGRDEMKEPCRLPAYTHCMLHGDPGATAETSPAELIDQYTVTLAEIIESVGVANATAHTEIDEPTLRAVQAGDHHDLDIDRAAQILSLAPDAPDPSTITAEARSHLLLQMTTAIVDIDVLVGDLDLDLDPQELHAKIEGRLPLTIREYAEITHQLDVRLAQ